MRNLFCLLFLLGIYTSVNARLYTIAEIDNFHRFDANLVKQNFISEFNNTQNSDEFISANHQKYNNPLNLESNYIHLLGYLETQPISAKNKDLIERLKTYQPQAMKMHEEGRLQIPVFNIQARAKGVENYWSYLAVKKSIAQGLNTNYLSALSQIKTVLSENHEAKTLAVKDSINMIDGDTKKQLSFYFINNLSKVVGIEKFVIDFAVINKDKILLDQLTNNLSMRNSEYLMRLIVNKFDKEYAIEKLIQQVNSDQGNRLSMTLLKPYANSEVKVQQFLMGSLNDKKFASAAAFSLSEIEDVTVLKTLHDKYTISTSEFEKSNIELALYLNKIEFAQNTLNQLKAEK